VSSKRTGHLPQTIVEQLLRDVALGTRAHVPLSFSSQIPVSLRGTVTEKRADTSRLKPASRFYPLILSHSGSASDFTVSPGVSNMADQKIRHSFYEASHHVHRGHSGTSSAPMHSRAFSDVKNGPECVGTKGRCYPFKVKLDGKYRSIIPCLLCRPLRCNADRYPMKDPAKYTEFERRYPPDRSVVIQLLVSTL